jgi:hypothetical protein
MMRAIRVPCFLFIACLLLACTQPNPGFVPPSTPGEGAVLDGALPSESGGRADQISRPPLDLPAPPDLHAQDDAPADGPSRVDAPSPCGAGETHSGGHCYSVVSGGAPMMYPIARQQCQKSGALPASVNTAAEHALVYGLVGSSSQGAWIGLLRTGSGKGDFVWESGASVSYTQWAAGEPNNDGGAENCVLIWGPGVSNPQLPSRWNDAPCHVPRDTVVCERVP